MKVVSEVNTIYDFEFWSGAVDTIKYLTTDEVETIISMLDDCYPDGMTATELNDFFWMEDETIAEWLGYDSFEDIMNRDDD